MLLTRRRRDDAPSSPAPPVSDGAAPLTLRELLG
jgi:hypothetical protein